MLYCDRIRAAVRHFASTSGDIVKSTLHITCRVQAVSIVLRTCTAYWYCTWYCTDGTRRYHTGSSFAAAFLFWARAELPSRYGSLQDKSPVSWIDWARRINTGCVPN